MPRDWVALDLEHVESTALLRTVFSMKYAAWSNGVTGPQTCEQTPTIRFIGLLEAEPDFFFSF